MFDSLTDLSSKLSATGYFIDPVELISDGASASNANQPVDFLIEYRVSRSFLVLSDAAVPAMPKLNDKAPPSRMPSSHSPTAVPSALDQEFEQQARLNAPKWIKWDGKQIETSIGDIRQWNNETVVSYSVYNNSDQPVEIVAPQIQITGRKTAKKKKKEGKGVLSDQLEIRDYKLSATRLEPGGRADGVVVFDRPNFKQSTEKLFLQLSQADEVDRPILIRLPFTPPIAAELP